MYPFIFFEHVNSFVVDLYCPSILCLVGYERDGLSNETCDKWTLAVLLEKSGGHRKCYDGLDRQHHLIIIQLSSIQKFLTKLPIFINNTCIVLHKINK